MVCFEIEEGNLDVNIDSAVIVSTVDGTADGKTLLNLNRTSSSLTTH